MKILKLFSSIFLKKYPRTFQCGLSSVHREFFVPGPFLKIYLHISGPESYVREYDKFMYLIDGRCEEEINKYIEESHTFGEFVEKVNFFVDLGGKINNNETLPKEVNLGMFELHCEDLISNLARKTTGLFKNFIQKFVFQSISRIFVSQNNSFERIGIEKNVSRSPR